VGRREERDRIEAMLDGLDWASRSAIGLGYGGRSTAATLAGLLRQAFAPELARGRDAEEALARVRAAVCRFPENGDVPVRVVLAAMYGEEQR
jgi:hypothetical protein